VFSIHAKDWLLLDEKQGLDKWGARGRFCELGAGNIGLDIAGVLRTLGKQGYDGWILVEHDRHLQDPLKDLAISREYLRKAGF
jgi:sugar phosphate isomerase/epimerase